MSHFKLEVLNTQNRAVETVVLRHASALVFRSLGILEILIQPEVWNHDDPAVIIAPLHHALTATAQSADFSEARAAGVDVDDVLRSLQTLLDALVANQDGDLRVDRDHVVGV